MNITLYQCISENNKLNKVLSNPIVLEGVLRDESSIINPIVLIEHENLSSYNYMHIQEFNRYYFITNIYSFRNTLWNVHCKCDVLMSYKEQISQLTVILSDSEKVENDYYLESGTWVSKVKDLTDIVQFPNGFLDDGEYILITAGGIT